MTTQFTVNAVFENGVFRPTQPLDLESPQSVTLIVQVPASTQGRVWPENTAQIYQEIAEEDRKLAEAMLPHIRETWPLGEEPK